MLSKSDPTASLPTSGCWSWRRRRSTSGPAGQPGRDPLRGHDPAGLLQPGAPATDDGPAPVIVLVNGLDSAKEHMYTSNHWEELAARGISCLMLDQPGTGEALRLQGMTARIDTEAWAGAAVDYLETRDDVDRLADRDRRLVARRLLRPARGGVREAVRPLSSPGAPTTTGAPSSAAGSSARASGRSRTTGSTCSGCGADDDLDTFIDFADDVHLDGVVEQITVPFLIAHGENDRQIPVEYAHRSYEQAVNSPSGSCGSSRPSTSASTTCPTSARSSPTGWPTPSPPCRRADRGSPAGSTS